MAAMLRRSARIWRAWGDAALAEMLGAREPLARPGPRPPISDEAIGRVGSRPEQPAAHLREIASVGRGRGLERMQVICLIRRQDHRLASHYAQMFDRNPHASQRNFEAFAARHVLGALPDHDALREAIAEVAPDPLILPHEALWRAPSKTLGMLLDRLRTRVADRSRIEAASLRAHSNMRSAEGAWRLRPRRRARPGRARPQGARLLRGRTALSDVALHGGELRQRQQGRARQGPPLAIAQRVGDEPGVEARPADPLPPVRGRALVHQPRAAPVVGVLPPELAQPHPVRVIDHRRGREHQRAAGRAPAPAEVPILPRGEREALVEAAEALEARARAAHVVGGEELGPAFGGAPRIVEVVAQRLARRREDPACDVAHPPADEPRRVPPMRREERAEPIRRRAAVVIGEGQEVRVGLAHAGVARRRGTAVGLPHAAHAGESRADRGQRLGAAVVHHHDRVGRGIERAQRRETPSQPFGTVVARDDHGGLHGTIFVFMARSSRHHPRAADRGGIGRLGWTAQDKPGNRARQPVLEASRPRPGEAVVTRSPSHRRPRALLFSAAPRSDLGGVQRMLDGLERALPEAGLDTFRIGPDEPEGAGRARLTLEAGAGASGRPALAAVPGAMGSLMALTRALARLRPDVVDVHFVTGAAAYFLALRPLFGYRLVLSLHGGDLMRATPQMRARLPGFLRAADHVTVVSDDLARLAVGQGADGARLTRIPNGVDARFWCPGEAPPEPRRIAAVGRLLPVKGFDLLIDAAAGLPDATVIVMGEGEARADLTRRIEAAGLGARVTLAGHVGPERMREELRRAALFAMPSRSEGMPLALIEALATGCPAVAARVGGAPEVLTPEAGALVPPDDAGALRDALAAGLSGEAAHSRAGARARAEAFSEAATHGAYAELLHALARPGRRAA